MTDRPFHSPSVQLFTADTDTELSLPLARGVNAGFPSPAEDFIELSLDLNRDLIRNPSATFFGRVRGDSMTDAGIGDGDILIIDKSVEPADGCKAVCFIDGEFTLKTLRIEKDALWLMPHNTDYEPVRISPDDNFTVWGIVTYVIRKMH